VRVVLALLLVLVALRARAEGAASAPAPPSLRPEQVARATEAGESPRADQAPGDDAVLRAFHAIEGLRLVRKRDGSFAYAGRGFNARIDARGGLIMTDKFSRASFVLDAKPIDAINWATYFFRISLGLMARLDKAFGNDPFRSERRDFLDRTRELRMALLERNAHVALDRALHKIWSAAASSPQQKKQATFELWTQCSDDTYGDAFRARIEQYVRERCAPGSACEYAPEELVLLNAPGAGRRPFAPYAADAGTP
jgi:hypothetical protein